MKTTMSLKQNDRGFASIVLALTLLIILGLISLGFAQLARREQQTALDKHLANQAYYAAESGVNDAIKNLATIKASGLPPNTCIDKFDPTLLPNKILDIKTDVQYSCVMVSTKLPSLKYDGVSPGADRIANFTASGSINTLDILWQSSDGRTTPRPLGASDFVPASGWDAPGVLEVTITPYNPANVDRTTMMNNTQSMFLYPSVGAGATVVYNPVTGQAPIVNGTCAATPPATSSQCKATIDLSSAAIPAGYYYLVHVINRYDASNITIGNPKDSSGLALTLDDGQAQIDATGRVRNVLKRIQVRVPTASAAEVPSYTLEAQTTCKRQRTAPYDATYNANGTNYDLGSPAVFSANECQLHL